MNNLTKYVIISLSVLIICMAPVGTNAYSDPSVYGGKLSTTIGDEATYEITTFQNYVHDAAGTQDSIHLANGTILSFNFTKGITYTFKLVTVNKSIPREIEHYYFQWTLSIPNKGTFTLPETAITNSQFGSSAFSGPAEFFGSVFPNSKNATAYYSQNLRNRTDFSSTTQYFLSSHNFFSIGENDSRNASATTPGYDYIAHEFNWKTGWVQYVYTKWGNASGTIFEFNTELINSHIPSKGLPGMTVISILPPFAVIAILTTIKRRKLS